MTTEQTKGMKLPSCQEAEQAVLALVAGGDSALLKLLELKDFVGQGHRILFSEFRLMSEAGEPVGDSVANARWFSSPQAKRRAAEAGEESLPFLVATLTQSFCSRGNRDYYLKMVRKARMQRMLLYSANELLRRVREEPDNPLKAVEWLHKSVNQIWERAYQAFPEEFQADE